MLRDYEQRLCTGAYLGGLVTASPSEVKKMFYTDIECEKNCVDMSTFEHF